MVNEPISSDIWHFLIMLDSLEKLIVALQVITCNKDPRSNKSRLWATATRMWVTCLKPNVNSWSDKDELITTKNSLLSYQQFNLVLHGLVEVEIASQQIIIFYLQKQDIRRELGTLPGFLRYIGMFQFWNCKIYRKRIIKTVCLFNCLCNVIEKYSRKISLKRWTGMTIYIYIYIYI